MADDNDAEDIDAQWLERKSAYLEESLGNEHDMVMHALIPYALGGSLDLYYYPNGVPGTAIATKELAEGTNDGPSNDVYRSYELVMFTRHRIDLDKANDEKTAFGRAHRNINAILNVIARYSEQATLNPNETCEFPADFEGIGGKCLVLDGYACHSDEIAEAFGLLAIIEVFRSEMEYARKHGGAKLIERLKAKGHYPYSDMERKPVA
jgi:Suppressor of fused protein (SUFU)